jgi:hypothetical protein
MALHKNFPDLPHAVLDPEMGRFPSDEFHSCFRMCGN